TYVDGVYIPRQTSAIRELFDIDRVEVLRGPQATLYGRNATGGAILITTSQPSDELTASGQAQVGSYDTQRHRYMLSGPLGDQINGRVSVVRDSHDGYSTDLTDRLQTDVGRFWGVRGALEARSADTVHVVLSGDYSEDRGSMGTSKAI